ADPFAMPASLRPGIIHIGTQNVTALTIAFPPGCCPLEPLGPVKVHIDGANCSAQVLSDRSLTADFRKMDGRWIEVKSPDDSTLRKRHGLQGPIDDAFMDSFLIVRPTGKPQHEAVGKWVTAEMNGAIEHWRRQFRGEACVKNDDAITAEDI